MLLKKYFKIDNLAFLKRGSKSSQMLKQHQGKSYVLELSWLELLSFCLAVHVF